MGKNLLLNSINIALEIIIYSKKVVMLYTKLLHVQQYTIIYSTVTSHNSQLINRIPRSEEPSQLWVLSSEEIYMITNNETTTDIMSKDIISK